MPKAVREQRRLICSTVDGFQGDERDVILYSWRYSPTQSPSILAFTNGKTGDQRVNVALTRARHQALHFISAPVDRFPPTGNAGQFMRHALTPERLVQVIEGRAHREPITEARRRAARALSAVGLRVVEQFVACGVGVDIVVHDPETWARAAIFIDGELDPAPPPTADRRVDAQGLLERAGWTVERVLAGEALADAGGIVARVRAALYRCGPRDRPVLDAERHITHALPDEEQVVQVETLPAASIAAEDLAEYHWPAPSVESRLAAGEDVFQSDFERELYDRLAQDENLQVVPQWRSRGKFIDLVITDRAGRRLAIEADGEQHHQTIDGSLIPEDIYRQEVLEEVGWVFHRVRLTEFDHGPDGQVEAIRQRLVEQPANEQLAAQVWGADDVSLAELEDTVAPIEAQPETDDQTEGPEAATELDDEPGITPYAAAEPGRAAAAPGVPADEPASPERSVAPAVERRATSEGRSTQLAETRTDGRPLDPEAYHGAEFDEVPLGLIPHQVGILVREQGRLSDVALIELYSVRFGVTVPDARRRLLTRFAWSAAGRKFVVKTDDEWLSGEHEPHAIEEAGAWTMGEIQVLARDLFETGLREDALFEAVISRVWDSEHRVSKPISKAVGSAIRAVVGRH